MDIQAVRLKNLRFLVSQHDRQQDFAGLTGISVQYLNHLLHGRRSIGEKTARKLEKSLNIDPGFLDRDADAPPDAAGCVSGLSRRAEMVGTLFDQLPPGRQDAIWEVVNALAQQGHKDADCG